MRWLKVFNSTTTATFRDSTQRIRDALADPAMREKVAQVRAEMDLEDARAAAILAIDELCETFKTQGPWATLSARQKACAALARLNDSALYRPELRLH